jgi:UDP-N-acetylglucosamine--N-acetylmuramyl-(pentapeptide) pyrophosphoryl-undecaprenol N-acetylglucosamine transferase
MIVAVAAAGTGGHVRPALAIAEALVGTGMPRSDIVFFGGDRYEADAVPAAGFPFVGFPLAKLDRTLTLRHVRIPLVVRSTTRAMAGVLERRRARVVLGMSGYVTVPAALAARRVGIPLLLQEQNASPGLATRFAARYAARTFLGLPGRAERLPGAELVGNPLRGELAAFDRGRLAADARRRYGLEEGSRVLGVLGGSLGARVLNEAVSSLAREWRGDPISIVHLSGPAAAEEMGRRAADAPLPWRCLPAEDRMDLFYAACDLVVCRAGAMTVSEVAATGTPAVFVPLRRVGQQHNAEPLAAAGGAVILPEAEIGRLPDVVAGVLGDEPRRTAMAAASSAQGRPAAADVIAAALREAAGE